MFIELITTLVILIIFCFIVMNPSIIYLFITILIICVIVSIFYPQSVTNKTSSSESENIFNTLRSDLIQ